MDRKIQCLSTPPDVCAKVPHFLFTFSENHRTNLNTKLELVRSIWKWVVEQHIEDLLFLVVQDVIDCWWLLVFALDGWWEFQDWHMRTLIHRSLNLSTAFRTVIQDMTGGRMELLYVPAGGTGRYQVNDTHLHKPMKGYVQYLDTKWYTQNVVTLNRLRYWSRWSIFRQILRERIAIWSRKGGISYIWTQSSRRGSLRRLERHTKLYKNSVRGSNNNLCSMLWKLGNPRTAVFMGLIPTNPTVRDIQ